MKALSLDAFKNMAKTDDDFRNSIIGKQDTIDFDNGAATIHRGNVMKYLEKYMCKSEEELEDTLWYSYGVFVKIVD